MANRLIDSDILIDHLNGRLAGATQLFAEAREGRLAIAMVSRFEVLAGARDDLQFVRMARFLRRFVQIPLARMARMRRPELTQPCAQTGCVSLLETP